jgi:hypothetical protein
MEDIHINSHGEEPRRSSRTMDKKDKPWWLCDRNTSNKVVAMVIPVLLCGAAGYATWVYIAQICGTFTLMGLTIVNFLMLKHHNRGLAGKSLHDEIDLQ